MTNLSDLPAEVLREILIHAVNVRGLKRGLRLRLVNKEFSQEVKSALYQSHAPGDYLQEWHPVRPELESEFDAFWHPYLTNKIIQKKWDDGSLSERIHRTTGRVTPHITIFVRGIGHRLMSRDEERRKERLCEIALCGGIYRAAERLCQISHPEEGSKETLYEVLKQYIYTFCSHPRRILARARFSSRRTKTCPFSDSLYFLEMALANDCHKGIRSALNDPAVEDMLSHSLERPCVYQCEHYITTSSAERGNMVFLAKIFANPTFQQKRKRIQSVAFNAAVRECRLDVVRFIMEPREHWSDVELIVNLNEDAIRCGVLKSRSVDFCFQLFGLLASRLRIPTVSAKHGPDTYNRHRLWEHLRYDNVLCIVASGSPQRADVAQWLLDHGASVSLTAEEEEILVKSTRRVYRSPLERAVKGGNEKIVRLLLDHGAGLKDVEATYYYAEAARQGRLDMIRILVEYVGSWVCIPYTVSSVLELVGCQPDKRNARSTHALQMRLYAGKFRHTKDLHRPPNPQRPTRDSTSPNNALRDEVLAQRIAKNLQQRRLPPLHTIEKPQHWTVRGMEYPRTRAHLHIVRSGKHQV
ncbi:hypothetical protein G6011_00113 [Alternaria panax]|uniref:Ankyrin n=1 Tax=Alternaria panax TaxID=48097 RepID=A0AAD4NUP8_9PLEO|nr:hypothetical protein G6011_00113 [Alternaria panax]